MTWYAIFSGSPASTDPVSTGDVIANPGETDADAITRLEGAGLTVVPLDGDPSGSTWDQATQKFVPTPPPLVGISPLQFIQRFTPQELAASRASADPNIQYFLFQVQNASQVFPGDPTVQAGLAYGVSINLLTSARAAVIGAS